MSQRRNPEHNRATTHRIIRGSVKKSKAITKALNQETEEARAKWEALLADLINITNDSERNNRAMSLFLNWKLERPSIERPRSKKP